MKYLTLIIVVFIAACDGPVDTTSTDLYQPDHYYEIDGWGTNPDVYEFTPKSNRKYTCIIIVENARGVFCIPKDRQ